MENNIKIYKAFDEMIAAINVNKITETFDEDPAIDTAMKLGYVKAISDVLGNFVEVIRKY